MYVNVPYMTRLFNHFEILTGPQIYLGYIENISFIFIIKKKLNFVKKNLITVDFKHKSQE